MMKNLTKAMTIIFIISLLFSCVRIKKEKAENQAIASHTYKKGVYGERVIINKNNIVSLQQILNKKLSKNWFVFANKYSLTVYYGKSCQEKFMQNVRDTTPGAPDKISRLEFFNGIGPDSVCYSPGVSLEYSEYKSKEEYKSRYPNNAIVKFEIQIRKEWGKAKYEQVLNRNDSMKQIVTEYLNINPRKFIVSEFSDYRFWVPLKNSFNFLPNKNELDFQRLPYHSIYFQNSIFIIQDKPYFAAFTSIEGDSKIGRERDKALEIIASALGISDFHLVN
jgi:hypothetical protein